MKSNYRHIEEHINGKIFILLLVLFYFLPVLATIPDSNGARQKAEMFFISNQPEFSKVKSSNQQELVKAYQSTTTKHTPLFVYQHQEKGFVIVAQNNQQFAIIGYSPEGKFRSDSIPPQLSGLLKLYEDSLQIGEVVPALKAKSVVAPLLDQAGINLSQAYHSEVGFCPSGCVATAFTQIMAYYKYPLKGIGSNCYTHPTYGQICADFENTNYDWNDKTFSSINLLMYHVGISMNMYYCGSQYGSSPSASDYVERIHKHFGYYLGGGPYGITNQSANIQTELDNRRPVYVELPGDPGHAVVLDGYDSNGMFHVNFGWGGQYNGYYALNTNTTFTVGYKFGTNIGKAVYMSPTVLKTNVQDSLALVAFHNNFNGTTGWDLKQPAFTWRGVLVMNGRVVSLHINNGIYLDFKGAIPTEIGNLTALKTLNLLGQFDGELPASIANLTELTELCIYGGQGSFKAKLPQNIGNLTKLETLVIPNKAEGEIPSSLGSMTQLRTLDLSNGNLTGTLPTGIGNLTKLERLVLYRNNLSGTVPSGISNLKELNYLSLAVNKFTGALPENFGNLTKLQNLLLSENQFSGKIPVSIGNCRLLTTMYLNDNQFEGSLPAGVGNLTGLEVLTLKNNKIDSLPNEIGRLKKVFSLDVSNNKLRTLPDSLKEMDKLYELYAQENEISYLSKNFGVCNRMKYVDLSKNKLKEFPAELWYARNLESVGLSNNLIEKFPSNIALIPPKLQGFNLDNNNLSGKIPDFLLTNPQLQPVMLRNNRFTFEDLPDSSIIYGQLETQQRVHLSKSVFKVAMGDTVKINIKDITPFKRTGNEYYWCLYPKYYDTGEIGDFPKDSILKVVISEKTINNRYYCKVANPSAPKYKYEIWTLPALNYVATDTLSFKLSTDEELIAEKYPKGHVVNALSLPGKKVEDRIVTLVPPLKSRGIIKWQASSDKTTWYDLSSSMTQNDLKSNFLTVKSNELVLSPKTPAFYRCSLQDTDCEPMYSDTIKVNPFGKVLLDSVVNVDSGLVKVKSDSIEIFIPKGIHKGDFRLTVVKLDNPPPAPEGVKMSSVYDVTVSFGDVFDLPIVIRLKNFPKKSFKINDIEKYQAVYFDEVNQKWTKFSESGINLKDTTLSIGTLHLTKLGFFEFNEMGYTHIFTSDRVNVIYQYGPGYDGSNMIDMYTNLTKKQGLQSWHDTNIDPDNDGQPYLIQDIAYYMNQIINKCKELGLETPSLRFNIYVKNIGNYGTVTWCSYMSGRGYMFIDPMYNSNEELMKDNRKNLMTTLAHEYTHYTQDYYMEMTFRNYFWQEAVAPIGGRMFWDSNQLPEPEPEILLNQSLVKNDKNKSIFDILSASWFDDYNIPIVSRVFSNSSDYNNASLFLHYMQNYRTPQLKADELLKETSYLQTWLGYLNSFVSTHLKSTTGDEFDDYVRLLFDGSKEQFTVLDLNGQNIFSHIIANAGATSKGTFAQSLIYNFEKDKNQPQKNNIDISVPYLAAKMVLLTNQTTDKNVLMNYKRKHSTNDEYKIYHGRYDLKQKKVVYVDISDSLEYNFMLDPLSDKPEYKHQNINFLLLVNKKCPSVVGVFTTFNASFELTATPVYDITSLLSAYVESKSKGIFINNFTGNVKNAFVLSGAQLKMSNPDLTYHKISAYNSTKTLLSPNSYKVTAYYESEHRFDFPYSPQGQTLPSIQNISNNMTVIYDCINGLLKIDIKSYIINKYETTYEEKPRIVKSSEWYQNGTLDLMKISMLIPGSDGVLFFSTNNSDETKAAIKNMSFSRRELSYNIDTGAVTSDKTSTYIDTDYSTDDVKLVILLNSE